MSPRTPRRSADAGEPRRASGRPGRGSAGAGRTGRSGRSAGRVGSPAGTRATRRPSAGPDGAGAATRSTRRTSRHRAAGALTRPGRRLGLGLVVTVVLLGFLLVGVFPTRAWLAQRDERSARQAELDTIEADQEALEAGVDRLETPEEVERIAREEYGMVREGETPFRMLPGAVAPVQLPDTWPFVGAEDWLNR